MPNPESSARTEGAFNIVDELLRLMRMAGEAGAPAPPGKRGEPPALGSLAADSGNVFGFLGQVYVLFMISGFRYWMRSAEVWGRVVPAIVGRLQKLSNNSGGGDEARAALIDELRASLRELAELPGQESRVLQAELDRLAGTMSPRTDGDKAGPHRRRWEVKP